MEFPVFVASDVHGEKVNLALHYNPRTTTLAQFLRTASRCFDSVAHFMRKGLLPAFSAAYIYSDVQCEWDVLQDRTQLSPCCQVYVFSQPVEEAVAVIPAPLDSLGLFSVHNGRSDTVSFCTCASRVPQPSRINLAASTSPMRLASNRWALPQSSQNSATTRPRLGAPSPLCKGSHLLLRFADPTTLDVATSTGANADGFRNMGSIGAAVPSRPARSHRFRLQIFSPPAETQMRRHEANLSAANTYASLTELAAAGPQALYLTPARRHSSKSYNAPSASPPFREEVAIPRSWYDPSRHSFHCVALRPHESGQLSPRSPSLLSHSRGTAPSCSARSGRPKPQVQAGECDPKLFALKAPPSGHGVSILREERERVAAQMRMGVDDLRSRLQEDTRQQQRTLNEAHGTAAFRR